MNERKSEVDLIQNPALGALAIWCFVLGYFKGDNKAAAPFNLAFLVLPLVANSTFREAIISTRASLYKMKTKVLDRGCGSSFLLLQETAPLLYELSAASIGIALSTNLIEYDKNHFGFVPLRKTVPNSSALSDVEGEYVKASQKLGVWMSQMPLWEVYSALGVMV